MSLFKLIQSDYRKHRQYGGNFFGIVFFSENNLPKVDNFSLKVTGGFNFKAAWTTGFIAGKNAGID